MGARDFRNTRMEATLVFSDNRDYATDYRIIVDLLRSDGRRLHAPTKQSLPIHISQGDLLSPTEHHVAGRVPIRARGDVQGDDGARACDQHVRGLGAVVVDGRGALPRTCCPATSTWSATNRSPTFLAATPYGWST